MKIRSRVSYKLILTYAVFGVLAYLIVVFAGTALFRHAVRQNAASELYATAVRIATEQSRVYTSAHSFDVSELEILPHVADYRALLISTGGVIVFDSEGSLNGRNLPDFDPADSASYSRTGLFYGAFRENMLSVIAPVAAGYAVRGYVTLHQPLSFIEKRVDSVLTYAYILFAVLVVTALAFFLVVQQLALRPLRDILEGVQAISEGNYDYRISLKRRDEFGYLADALNVMAGDLKAAEDYQKRFIANVSHDFRSPLTSIRGYLQAMLDGVIPPEEQGRYMQVIIGETERLTKLTQEVLSLSSMDRGEMTLTQSDFDIVALVKKIVRTFEGACLPRGIRFELEFSSPALPVHADYERIQQVLYNLIDNAVKFSENDSVIRIRQTERGDLVYTSVRDYGAGIPAADLKKIFTRFYKSDSSRGRDRSGTGLGLSIVKEILNAHHTTIDVTSTVGSGSEFTFPLPMPGRSEAEE